MKKCNRYSPIDIHPDFILRVDEREGVPIGIWHKGNYFVEEWLGEPLRLMPVYDKAFHIYTYAWSWISQKDGIRVHPFTLADFPDRESMDWLSDLEEEGYKYDTGDPDLPGVDCRLIEYMDYCLWSAKEIKMTWNRRGTA